MSSSTAMTVSKSSVSEDSTNGPSTKKQRLTEGEERLKRRKRLTERALREKIRRTKIKKARQKEKKDTEETLYRLSSQVKADPWGDLDDQGSSIHKYIFPPVDTSDLEELEKEINDAITKGNGLGGPYGRLLESSYAQALGNLARDNREIDEINRNIIELSNYLKYLREHLLKIDSFLDTLKKVKNGELGEEHVKGKILDNEKFLENEHARVTEMIAKVENEIDDEHQKAKKKIDDKRPNKRKRSSSNGSSNGGTNKTRKANKTRRAHKK
jgi:hypothetical protein